MAARRKRARHAVELAQVSSRASRSLEDVVVAIKEICARATGTKRRRTKSKLVSPSTLARWSARPRSIRTAGLGKGLYTHRKSADGYTRAADRSIAHKVHVVKLDVYERLRASSEFIRRVSLLYRLHFGGESPR